jgi:hypothetical protein
LVEVVVSRLDRLIKTIAKKASPLGWPFFVVVSRYTVIGFGYQATFQR